LIAWEETANEGKKWAGSLNGTICGGIRKFLSPTLKSHDKIQGTPSVKSHDKQNGRNKGRNQA